MEVLDHPKAVRGGGDRRPLRNQRGTSVLANLGGGFADAGDGVGDHVCEIASGAFKIFV